MENRRYLDGAEQPLSCGLPHALPHALQTHWSNLSSSYPFLLPSSVHFEHISLICRIECYVEHHASMAIIS